MKLSEIKEIINSVSSDYLDRSTYAHEGANNEMEYLFNLIKLNNVKNVLEIGTFKGVSSTFFSKAITGEVNTINFSGGKEYKGSEIEKAKELWEKSGSNNINLHDGSSIDVLPDLVTKIDKVQLH